MNKRTHQTILIAILALWAAALLVYGGWSLVDYFLIGSTPTVYLRTPWLATPTNLAENPVATKPIKTKKTVSPIQTEFADKTSMPFTSTPLPTLPSGSRMSSTPTSHRAPTQPPVYYFGLMTQLYTEMVGQWRGMVSITINKQARPNQLILIEFFPACQTGEACGKYHWETGCFGELVLMKWRPDLLVFRNVEYSGSESCPIWVEYAVQPKPGDTLYLSMSFRDEDLRRISKTVTLRRR